MVFYGENKRENEMRNECEANRKINSKIGVE